MLLAAELTVGRIYGAGLALVTPTLDLELVEGVLLIGTAPKVSRLDCTELPLWLALGVGRW